MFEVTNTAVENLKAYQIIDKQDETIFVWGGDIHAASRVRLGRPLHDHLQRF